MNNSNSKQKTWTELVGKCQMSDSVDGNKWIRRSNDGIHHVLWVFDSEQEARDNFHRWWWGMYADTSESTIPNPDGKSVVGMNITHVQWESLGGMRNVVDSPATVCCACCGSSADVRLTDCATRDYASQAYLCDICREYHAEPRTSFTHEEAAADNARIDAETAEMSAWEQARADDGPYGRIV